MITKDAIELNGTLDKQNRAVLGRKLQIEKNMPRKKAIPMEKPKLSDFEKNRII